MIHRKSFKIRLPSLQSNFVKFQTKFIEIFMLLGRILQDLLTSKYKHVNFRLNYGKSRKICLKTNKFMEVFPAKSLEVKS